MSEGVRSVAPGLWVADRPFSTGLGPVRAVVCPARWCSSTRGVFDRITATHGDVVEHGAHEAFRNGVSFLPR